VGPPVAGILLLAFGLGGIFVTDLATVALALVALGLVRIPNPPRSNEAGRSGVWRDFVAGLQYVFERPSFTFLALYLAAVVFGWGFVYALSGPLMLGIGNEAAMGLSYAAFGVGSVVGAAAVGAWRPRAHRIPGILGASLVLGVAITATGLRPSVPWVVACVALSGTALTVVQALNRVVFQLHGAPEVLGRVFAFRLVLVSMSQSAGTLLAGTLAARVFEPAMAEGGAWAPRLGHLVGQGPGRGAGVLITLVGMAIVALSLLAAASRRVRRLEHGLALDVGSAAVPAGPPALR
jgi:predicted MFS family arabinose efflux permease